MRSVLGAIYLVEKKKKTDVPGSKKRKSKLVERGFARNFLEDLCAMIRRFLRKL